MSRCVTGSTDRQRTETSVTSEEETPAPPTYSPGAAAATMLRKALAHAEIQHDEDGSLPREALLPGGAENDHADDAAGGWHLLATVAKRRGMRTEALRTLCHRLGVSLRRASRRLVFVRPAELDEALAALPQDRPAPSRCPKQDEAPEITEALRDMLHRRR